MNLAPVLVSLYPPNRYKTVKSLLTRSHTHSWLIPILWGCEYLRSVFSKLTLTLFAWRQIYARLWMKTGCFDRRIILKYYSPYKSIIWNCLLWLTDLLIAFRSSSEVVKEGRILLVVINSKYFLTKWFNWNTWLDLLNGVNWHSVSNTLNR